MAEQHMGPVPSRRALLAGAAGMAVVAGPAVSAAADPDAELIQLCRAYVDACVHYDATSGMSDAENAALWGEIDAIRARIEELPVHGVRGLCALARVAAYLARQPDGTDDFCAASTWSEMIVAELLDLFGEA